MLFRSNLEHLTALEVGTELFYQEIVNLGSQVMTLEQENRQLTSRLNALKGDIQ